MSDLRIVDNVCDSVDGCEWDVVASQLLYPVSEALLRKMPIELGAQRLVVVDTRLSRVEPRIAGQCGRAECRYESFPEFFQRGQVNREQAPVGRAQNIGLREPGTVTGSWDLSQ